MAEESREFNAASFYEYLKEGRLMGVRCRDCGHLSALPRPLCAACHSRAVQWHQFSGTQTVGKLIADDLIDRTDEIGA